MIRDSSMLSVMTVVLPQHSNNSAAAANTTVISSTAKVGRKTSAAAVGTPAATKTTARCENCESLCRADMTKNNLPQRCPFLKGYVVEPRRHHHAEPVNRHHPPHHQQQPLSSREWESLREAACFWKDKYDRLYESQRRLQKVNEGLEEKLLKVAEKFESEKSDLTRDVSDLTSRLVEARLTIAELEEENEQYRNDCNIAVRLLQCKPSNFVAHKFNSLPVDFQAKVKRHLKRGGSHRPSVNTCTSSSSSSLLDQCPPDVRTIKVSVPTLPPAAMVYSVNQVDRSAGTTNHAATTTNTGVTSSSSESTPDHVSAAIIAKVLEERSRERQVSASYTQQRIKEGHWRQCDVSEVATQTSSSREDVTLVCPRCLTHSKWKPRSPSASSTDSGHATMSTRCQGSSSSSTETAI